MNPYLHPVWSYWIRGAHHGGAQVLQNLALHLYNSREWPVDLDYICSMSDDHWEAALAMILDYRENGEKIEISWPCAKQSPRRDPSEPRLTCVTTTVRRTWPALDRSALPQDQKTAGDPLRSEASRFFRMRKNSRGSPPGVVSGSILPLWCRGKVLKQGLCSGPENSGDQSP